MDDVVTLMKKRHKSLGERIKDAVKDVYPDDGVREDEE